MWLFVGSYLKYYLLRTALNANVFNTGSASARNAEAKIASEII